MMEEVKSRLHGNEVLYTTPGTPGYIKESLKFEATEQVLRIMKIREGVLRRRATACRVIVELHFWRNRLT